MNAQVYQLVSPLSVNHLAKRGIIGIVVLVILVVLWMVLAPLSAAIVAHGAVKVDKERKLVQHLEGGIVKEILVADGQQVQRGEALLVIADMKGDASVDSLRHEFYSELMRNARLRAERDGASKVVVPVELNARIHSHEVDEIVRVERHLFAGRLANLEQQVALLRSQMDEVSQEIVGWNGQFQAGEQGLDLMRQELHINEKLLEKNFVTKARVLGLQRQVTDYQTKRENNVTEQARARQKKLDMQLQIVRLRTDYMQHAALELEDATRKLNDLKERLRPSVDAQDRQVVRASVSGKIVGLKAHTAGGIIAPGAVLMEILPDNQELIVEAKVPVEDIDELHLEMSADIRLSAYQLRTAQLLKGTVSYVSADRLNDEVSHMPYYAVEVKVDPASLASAENIKLIAGMPAEVYIKTKERTLLDYLLAPITQSLRRGMRET